MPSNVIKSQYKLQSLGFESVSQLLVHRLKQSSNTVQFIDGTTGRYDTRQQTLDYALNFASYLVDDCRIRVADVVLFVTRNTDIHAIAICGVLFAGAVYASIPVHSTPRELQEVIEVIGPVVLVLDSTNYNEMANIVNKSGIKTIVMGKHENNKYLNIEDIFKRQTSRTGKPVLPVPSGIDDTVTYVMTSGSTGRPKAVRRTNGNHLAVVTTFGHQEVCPLTPADTLLSTGFCHICGQRSLFSAIESGACLLIQDCDESHQDVFDTLKKYRVTQTLLVPTQLNWLIKNGQHITDNDLQCLRQVFTGAAPLSQDTYLAIRARFPKILLQNSYGMSESGFALFVHTSDANQLGNVETVGKINPGMEIVILDNNNVPKGANELGEICMKGDQVTPGYVNNSQENEKLFTETGFLRSGDIGYYDDKQYFYIVGRMKEIISVDGVSVSLAELERLLIGHKSVVNAAVIAVPDDSHGEVPMAFVTVVDSDSPMVTEHQLIQWVDQQVNDHKKLRGGLRIVEKFPVTPSGKIRKQQLLKQIVY